MSNVFEFDAVSRTAKGTGSAKASRRNGNIPAVVYGGAVEPQVIELNHNEVVKSLANEAVYSHILKLNIDGKEQNAILKDMQRHPAKTQILHMDFVRVNMEEAIRVNVPLHFINEDVSVGVKAGGVVTHSIIDIEVSCLPGSLPEYIEVDLMDVDMGGSVHLSDLKVPEGVEIIALTHGEDHDLPVAQIMQTRGGGNEEESAEDETATEPDAE